MALITSNGISGGTFDKRDNKVRKYIAQRCDLIGAIRLPNNAFVDNAGTDITTDGSHIAFSGMNPEYELRKHQKNAVAHILTAAIRSWRTQSAQAKPLKWQPQRWNPNGSVCAINPCLLSRITLRSNGRRSSCNFILRQIF